MEVTEPDAAGDRRVVDVGDVVGIVDLVEQLEAPLLERPAEVGLARDPDRDPARVPRVGAQLGVAEPLREQARLARLVSRALRRPDAAGDQRPGSGGAVRLGELQRPVDPAVHELAPGRRRHMPVRIAVSIERSA